MAGSVTRSQSKRKKAKLSNDKDIVVDRISNLPDSLLCHILSFLPTKEAVGTSILSNRWKPLWTLVPKLDLDEVNIKYKPLTHIVYRILALHIAPFLKKFSLRIKCGIREYFHVETCIYTAMMRNLQQLQLEIVLNYYTVKPFRFPHRFFSCKTLVVLELRERIEIDLPSSLEFPSLKILSLIRVCYSNDDCFSRLISSCPVLEDLSFEKAGIPISKFKICVPTLKRLRMKFRKVDYELVIDAPALDYFEFQGDLRNFNFLKEVAKLVEAHVDIKAVDCYDNSRIGYERGYERGYGDRVFRLVKELHNAKFLSLSPGDKECIDFGSIYPSIFKNLVRLNFGLERCNWHVLQALLQVAPNLEVLVVKKSYNGENKLGWMEPLHGPTPSYTPGYLLSHLTTFNFHQFEGSDREVEFVKYILKEARVLKTLTIKVTGKLLKESVLQKLSMFPRHSATCLFTVE